MVVGINSRYKRVLNLAMSNLLNSELIQDDPIFQVHAGSRK